MKKYRPGQLITIEGRIFRVTRAASKYKRCVMCQLWNIAMPCTYVYNYPHNASWNTGICNSRLPEDCYLRDISKGKK